MLICLYCKRTGSEMFAVLQARGPKGIPYRWQRIGHCCDRCEAAGQPIRIE